MLTRKFFIWINSKPFRGVSEKIEDYQRKKGIANYSAPKLPPVDPDLYKWLEAQKLNVPAEEQPKPYTLETEKNPIAGDRPFVQFGTNRFYYYISNDEGNRYRINGALYNIITIANSKAECPKLFESSRCGLVLNDETVLIPPYFYFINYIAKLHVFVASTYTDRKDYREDSKKGIYDCYVFNIKGKLLSKYQGSYYSRLPTAAIDIINNQQTLVSIKPLPIGYHLEEIISPYLFVVVSSFRLLGIISSTGEILLPCKYSTVIVKPPYNYAIMQRKRQVYSFNFSTSQVDTLPFEFILDNNDDYVRAFTGFEEFDRKWGFIGKNGNVIIPPKYDYVEFGVSANRFTVFEGKYFWNYGKAGEALFDKYLDASDVHKQDDYHGQLDVPGWGVIDETGKEILPTIYNWVEDTGEVFMVNKGGFLLGWYSGHYDVCRACIFGGLWAVYDKDGVMLEDFLYDNVCFLLNKYRGESDGPINESGESGLYTTNWTGELDFTAWEARLDYKEEYELQEEAASILEEDS